MSVGQVSTIVVCQSSSVATSGSTCPPGMELTTQQVYVIDPSSQSLFESQAQPFDYTVGAGFFGVAFITTVSLWIFAKMCGLVLKQIR